MSMNKGGNDMNGFATEASGWWPRQISGWGAGLLCGRAANRLLRARRELDEDLALRARLRRGVQGITGFFLWMYYSPSAQTAWESVYYLQNEVAGGWLLRAIHHYSAPCPSRC